MSNENKTPNQPKQLSRQEGEQLAGAVQRFYELRGQTIKTPTADAELKGLTEYLATTFIDHAGEFLGCWIAVRDEYEPALNMLARIQQRLDAINAQYYARVQAAQAAAQAQAEGKSNVSPLVQP